MSDPIAVIGMAARLPDAANLNEFWSNLVAGRNSIHRLSEEQLLTAGATREDIQKAGYVRARPLLDDVWGIDRRYFGMSERECVVRNPQHRLLLELCSSALQNAGYVPGYGGVIGLYAGCASDRYAEDHLRADPELFSLVGETGISLANNPDYLTSFVSYRLGLTGPSIPVRTACSSSLVAVHMAGQALRAGECDIALAGGVEIEMPYGLGYRHIRGGVESPDGVCRPLDAGAGGTVFGSGGGVVVLKRLDEALSDEDTVWGLIRGSAVNNDGSERATFTSPSVEGQRRVIAEALAVAGVDPVDLSYVELHGTATQVGDPVEVQGLNDALCAVADGELPTESCVIGSVKSNIGHLGPAAGVAGLIKTVLAMTHELIPPTANFRSPNPLLELEKTPFRVADRLLTWPRTDADPRLAGVSSFGFGGTNAHVVLEEGPLSRTPRSNRPGAQVTGESAEPELLVWSGYDDRDEAGIRQRLAAVLDGPTHRLADIAFTMQVGRDPLPVRAALRCRNSKHAASTLADPAADLTARSDGTIRPVVFVFPDATKAEDGVTEWSRHIADRHNGFAAYMGQCIDLFSKELDLDLAEAWRREPAPSRRLVKQLAALQFSAEYALGQMFTDLGVQPAATMGHGAGTLVAATVFGALSLQDAVRMRCGDMGLGADSTVRPAAEAVPPLHGIDTASSEPLLWLTCGSTTGAETPWRDFGIDGTDQQAAGVLHHTDGSEAWDGVLDALARVWVNGTDVAWEALLRPSDVGRVPLPHYPYERREYVAPRRAANPCGNPS
ncbi:beta-ketoacyl synthase N-terminal-like domain-containing protein [Streptomyces sp. HSG2]|uniref:beta-ketoacyl synthase N-terminal-like domain-containing protein n=1 Tax=Streptomyces sp. HSG2 TaxID=2797167 RepID=UPI0019031D5C|nr:beta-ketoacyl synthase N-terminal-like domain-containing protein [Streptomyces sp. HSG2]